MNKKPKLNFLQQINVQLPERKIFTRLGFNHYKSQVQNQKLLEYRLKINTAFHYCHTKGVWFETNINSCNLNSGKINLECGITFHSKKLAKLLKNSNAVALFAATVGKEIIKQRDKLIEEQNSASALIYDAVGGEVVDEAMNFIQKIIAQNVSRTSRKLTKMRFSAGYADFDLTAQKEFYNFLKLNELDISLNENFIMHPEKSVTAIIGIEQ